MDQRTNNRAMQHSTSGVEALSLAQQHGPDVVLVDRDLPDLDALAVAQQIAEQQPASQVIMMTRDSDDQLQSSLLPNMRCVLVKPIRGTELFAAIRRIGHAA